MGGSDSKIQSGQLYDESNYTFIKQIDDERYGLIKILQANQNIPELQNMKICVLNKTVNSEEEFDNRVKHASGRKDLRHPSLVQFFNYSAEKNEEFCSTFWKVSSVFEYVNQDLQQQLQIRHQIGQQNAASEDVTVQNSHFFTEGQMWYLLKACVDGLTYLRSQQIIHGDIRPTQILLTDDGRVKLGEQFGQQESLSGYQQLLMGQRTDQFYISPVIFESLKQKNPNYQFEFSANDVFSLGLTILEAGILKDADECYDVENYTFRCEQLQAFLEELRSRYSERFCNIVTRMLIESDEQRPRMDQIHSEIEQYCQEEYFRRDIPDNIIMYIIGQPQVEQSQVIEQPREPQPAVEPIEQPREPVGEATNIEELRRPVEEERRPVEEVIEEQVVHQGRKVQGELNAAVDPQQLVNDGQVEVVQTNVVVPQVSGYDMKDIDDKINRVLAMSRDTVRQYGGEKAYQAYENYTRTASPGAPVVQTTTTYVQQLNSSPQQATKVVTNIIKSDSPVKVEPVVQQQQEVVQQQQQEEQQQQPSSNNTYTMQFNSTSNYQANQPQVVSQVTRTVENNTNNAANTYVVSSQAQPYRYQPAENTTTTYQSYQQNEGRVISQNELAGSRRVISTTTTPQAAATTTYTNTYQSYQPSNNVIQQGADDLNQQIQRSLQKSKELDESINQGKRQIGENAGLVYQQQQ